LLLIIESGLIQVYEAALMELVMNDRDSRNIVSTEDLLHGEGNVSDSFDRFCESTLFLLKELGCSTDLKISEEISTLVGKTKSARSIDDLVEINVEIARIIPGWIQRFNSERDDTTLFLKRLSEKLSTIEKDITESTDMVASQADNDISFTENLKVEISSISDKAEMINAFEDLKTYIESGLERINVAVDDKQRELGERRERFRNFSECFLEGFENVFCKVRDQIKNLEEQSRLDPLTGIYNRRVLHERLESELSRFRRYKQSFSLIFFDVDHFKAVNDNYGHKAGDVVLTVIARRVGGMLRKADFLARYGGEEFVAILPETSIDQATEVAGKIRQVIARTRFEHAGNLVPVTVSIGVTEIREGDEDPDTVLGRADTYMYFAKENGRDRVISDIDFHG